MIEGIDILRAALNTSAQHKPAVLVAVVAFGQAVKDRGIALSSTTIPCGLLLRLRTNTNDMG